MGRIKGAIFDLDGTLFDSLWVWEEIDRRFFATRGIDVPSDYSQAISSMNFITAAEYTIKRFGFKEQPEMLVKEWTEMARLIYANDIKLKDGAKEFLSELTRRKIKLGIATSSSKDLYMPALVNNGIDGLFSAIMDTFSTRDKIFPDIYLSVAQKLGVSPSECVVFEDLPEGLKSAEMGGFKTIAVYDKHAENCEESIADVCIKDFKEIGSEFFE